ncbi:urea ABC transporter, permease protein UrtB [Klebsiella pneumoniae]|uniref:Urea ABC transporter, permease protein UrtB n=1 Tax=Klebsiella pneumoniae TaxID=573 RepID=A0A2X3EQ08_KLEPN|nr:urea ABC transporter, permease protein UrtB [Klebsiella pneumoniae]
MLIQLVRMLFGAQNVEVANPAWLSGGVQVLPNLILPWNRLAVLAFVLLVLCFTWLILNRTRLGMNVRAVTQNRAMAACCGVPTGRVDMLAFGLGSVLPGWAAWRCRSLATSGLNWVRDTSSTRFWWWCWVASASWPAAWRRPLGWHFQQNSRTANGRGAGQDPDPGDDYSVYSETPTGSVRAEREGY